MIKIDWLRVEKNSIVAYYASGPSFYIHLSNGNDIIIFFHNHNEVSIGMLSPTDLCSIFDYGFDEGAFNGIHRYTLTSDEQERPFTIQIMK